MVEGVGKGFIMTKEKVKYIIYQIIIIGIIALITLAMIGGLKEYYKSQMIDFPYFQTVFEMSFLPLFVFLCINLMVNTFSYKDFKEYTEERKRLKEKREKRKGEKN